MVLSRGAFKLQPEPAAFSRLRLDADISAHALGCFADKGKTDAGAFIALVELLEHVENPVLVFRRDADAVVLEPEADHRNGLLSPTLSSGGGEGGAAGR